MKAYLFVLNWLQRLNSLFIKLGQSIAWVCVALMVASILLQVIMRYVFNNALPWPEEVARAFMIWMMALVAAGAYRQGSFVAIEMLHDYLPLRIRHLTKTFLYICALLVLYQLFVLGLEFFQRGFRTRAASFDLQLAWIYLAMPVCFGSMLLVNIELLLKEMGPLFFKRFDDHLSDREGRRPEPEVFE